MMPFRVNTHDQMIDDAIAKASKLAANLERDVAEMASADPEGRRLTENALHSAQALIAALQVPPKSQSESLD